MEVLKKIFVFLIVVLPFSGNSQITFFKKFASSVFDSGNGLTQLPDSNYAITGGSAAFDENSGQAYLMIADTLGIPLWAKDYGGVGDDIGIRVMHLPGEGFYIAGYTNSTAKGDFDFVVYRTDEQGELQWEKNYGTPDWEKLNDAQLLADGGLILAGQTEGLTTDKKDIYLVRTDSFGDTIWTKTISTPEDDIAYGIDTISNTHFVIGGNMGENGISKGMIAAYNISDGTEEWIRFYNQSGTTLVRDIAVFDGSIFAVGGLYNSNQTRYDEWIARSEINGYFMYDWTYERLENALLNSLSIRDKYSVFVSLHSRSPEIDPYPIGNDTYVKKLGVGLEYKHWSANYSSYGEDIVNQMIPTLDGGVAIIGTCSESLDQESSLALGQNIMFIKVGPDGEYTLAPETSSSFVGLVNEEKTALTVYPNPTDETIHLPKEVAGKHFQVVDFQGKIVLQGNAESTLSLLNIDTGIYFLKITDSNHIWTCKIVKQ